jgi:predicted HD phosphohydrolase
MTQPIGDHPTPSFRSFDEATADEVRAIDEIEARYAREGLADRVLAAVQALATLEDGYPVDRFVHSLQTATRAMRDGADTDMIVGALIHDIGDHLAPFDHGSYAAAVLRPYVRDEVTWVVEQHVVFQRYHYAHHVGGDRHARERYRGHPHFDACVRFCADWDQASFDPDYDHEPLATFAPLVREVFGRPPGR